MSVSASIDCQLPIGNWRGFRIELQIGNWQLAIHYGCRLTITSVMSSAALVPCANFVNDDSIRSRMPAAEASTLRDTTSYNRVAPNSSPVGLTASVTPSE